MFQVIRAVAGVLVDWPGSVPVSRLFCASDLNSLLSLETLHSNNCAVASD